MSVKEFIFMGTGTSGNVPNIYCLTETPINCKTCLEASKFLLTKETNANDNVVYDKENANEPIVSNVVYDKNRRRNTSAVLRYLHSDGAMKNILIDCGKTFYESALLTFTSHKLRRIDAVILTHGHADAMLGLDDLRQWYYYKSFRNRTMNARVQDKIDIYLTKETFERVEQCFPYLVDRSAATGGGEVATLSYHIFDEHGLPDSFYIDELEVKPLPVHHGKYSNGNPFLCMGFRFENICYISDTNYIPEQTMEKMKNSDTVIIDALSPKQHASHFSYEQALNLCIDILPQNGRGYFIGLSHLEQHDVLNEWIKKELEKKDLAMMDVQVAYDNLKITI